MAILFDAKFWLSADIATMLDSLIADRAVPPMDVGHSRQDVRPDHAAQVREVTPGRTDGRHHGAFGGAGGSAGAVGVNRVERADGTVEALDHIGQVQMRPGDVFVIETPGGGGWGEVAGRS